MSYSYGDGGIVWLIRNTSMHGVPYNSNIILHFIGYLQKLQVDYEVTLWSYTSKDVAQLLDSASLVRE